MRAEPSTLVQGQSTKSDVLRLFGPPTQIMHQTDGDAFVYTYRQYNYSSFHVQDPREGGSATGQFRGQLKGVVRPLLEWT